jgi:hypothetical protein
MSVKANKQTKQMHIGKRMCGGGGGGGGVL